MPSFNLFILQNTPTDGGVPEGKLGFLGTAENKIRPLGDVEACRSVSVCFVVAFDASKVAVAFPVLSTDMPAPWTSLAGVVRLDLFDGYAFPLSHMFQGMSEEAVGNTVNLPSALLSPFSLTLPEFSKPF